MKNFLLVIPFLLLGCIKPFVEVSPNWNAEPVQPAILAGAAASFDTDEDAAAGTAIMDMAMNSKLPEFGEQMMEKLKPFLAEQGFTLSYAHDRVSTVEQESMEKVEKLTSIAAGSWTSPEGSMIIVTPGALFRGKAYETIIERAVPQPGEHFAFISTRIYDAKKFVVMGYVRMILDVVIIDSQGNEVYTARGIGDGPMTPFVALHHVEALTEALDKAMVSIKETPVVVTE